ncbi:MAG: TonB-dependent receptor [Chitinophagia bacterium]|nr:TonB-dependent receptor [Chitinophagia bacterium]
MKKVILLTLLVAFGYTDLPAQTMIKLMIQNATSKEPLLGATVTLVELNKTSLSDSTGIVVFQAVPTGTYTISVAYVGFSDKKMILQVSPLTDSIIHVLLEASEEEEEEIIVTATRISRTIANTPTRTEVISGEELAEKGNMKPGDIRMLLNESTGIQTQQTSATSFNAGIRIQGLEGRYTQLLRDGYPLFSGFAGSLSVLQIAPLDLKQVEVIKGAASTLFGGGAIAGLVNLVSKTPGENRELSFLANATTAGGLDISSFYSEKYGKVGATLFASRNSNKPFDPASLGLTAIPKFERYTFNPRLFFYGDKTTADIGIAYITENRTGGSMRYITSGTAGFFEKNNTDRFTTQLGVSHHLSENETIQFKNSFSSFNRNLLIPDYSFKALQHSSFSELTWNKRGEKSDWVVGSNLITENLTEKPNNIDPIRDYHLRTVGVFIQHVWSIDDNIKVESGVRGDYVTTFGFELLPRISAMFTLTPDLTTRIGGGFGYKAPSIFTEEAERRQFSDLLPISSINARNERSKGLNWDINYKTNLGRVGLSFNQLFFYTTLAHPLVLTNAPGNKVKFENAGGSLTTKGMETNLRLTYADVKLFLGYTYTDANTYFDNAKQWLPLTARHRLNNVLMYEIDEKLKLGLEAYYFSKQRLSDGRFGKSYWITGFMAEKLWEKWSLFINFENFTNTRQSKFDTIYTGTLMNPIFSDIYAPVDGFVVNGGLKIRL